MPTEIEIRDYLAEHLDLVEGGLALLRKEYPLSNPTGAGGFIDILARDRFGHRVVIEVKRSDKVARTALQELHKYVELLRNNHGLAADKVRCIVASTEWHELLTPFSHFARTVGYHVEGRKIVLDGAGIPAKLLPVEPLQESPELSLSPIHHALFFLEAAHRDAAIPYLVKEMEKCKVSDFVAILLDYSGGGDRYPFCLYLALNKLGPDRRVEVETALGAIDNDYKFYGEWCLEAQILGQLHYEHTISVDGGSPEVFRGMLTSWRPVGYSRHGILRDEGIVTDVDVLGAVSGLEGVNPVVFTTTASPRYPASWAAMQRGIQHCLNGNLSWTQGVAALLEDIKKSHNTESVAIEVYNPMSLIFCLWKFHREQSFLFLPQLQCVSQTEAADTMRVIVGSLDWDEKTFPQEPAQLISNITGPGRTRREVITSLMMYRTFGEMCTLEDRFLTAHGLRYILAEFTIQGGVIKDQSLLGFTNGRISRSPLHGRGQPTIVDFFQKNHDYIENLSLLLEANVCEIA